MSTVAQAYVQIVPSTRGIGRQLDDGMGPELDRAGLTGGRRMGSSMTSGFGAAVAGLARTGALALAAVGVVGAKAGIETAAAMERAEISFTTMLGDGDRAKALLSDLAKFAAETPFDLVGLQESASKMLAVGVGADKVIPIMRTLGNVTSGMGTGAEGIQRATLALQQMTNKGKITGEEMMQLQEAGINGWTALAAATGKSVPELQKLSQSGKLGSESVALLMDTLASGKGFEKFNGLMEAQSKSLSGLWANLGDTINQGLGQAVQPLIPLLKDGLGKALEFVGEWLPKVGSGIASAVGWFQNLGASTAGASASASGIVTAIRGFIDVALPIVKQFTDGMRQRIEPMMPMVRSIFSTIGEIVSAAMEYVKTVIEAVTKVIAFVWGNWGEGIMNVLGIVFGALGGIVQGALNVIKGIISTVTALIKGDWSGAWNGIKGIVSGAWQAITSAVSGAAQGLWEIVKGIPPKILSALGGLGSLLWDKGVEIVRGLMNGIASMGSTIAGWLKQWVLDHIPGPIAQALGIASPSKVTAEQGRNIVRGLTLGMTGEGSRLDSVVAGITSRLNFGGAGGLALAGAGSALPSTVVLSVGDREFTAYVDERASGVVSGVADMARAGRRSYP